MKKAICWVLVLLLLLVPAISQAANGLQQLLQLIDYMGVDYQGAVADGKVINAAEYEEMEEFAASIQAQVAALADDEVGRQLYRQSQHLTELVAQKARPDELRRLSAEMRRQIIGHYELDAQPRLVPDLALGQRLYSQNCSSCHGLQGRGDGPMAMGMEPAPTDFSDRARYLQRTLYGLYSTISFGVEGTAMPGFSILNDHERWSLAFFVGQMAISGAQRQEGEALWQRQKADAPESALHALTTQTPAEVLMEQGEQALALAAYLRSQPQRLFSTKEAPLSYSRKGLMASLALYRAGEKDRSYQQAVDAYLEGFELVEGALNAVDGELRLSIEKAMTGFRARIRQGVPVAELEQSLSQITALIDQAQTRLESGTLSNTAAFSGALVILLREGLEALLVVAALAAFLIKTGRRDGLPYLYGGLGVALAMGGLTWLASVSIIDISGAQRELTEGVAAVVAAGCLFYVGFWLHGKTSAANWKRFIEGSVQRALGQGTLWGLAGLSFIAVYREIFETVLFYQALWVQSDAAGHAYILSGLVSAAGLLAVCAWLILRYSTRLPLRQFFAISGVFMFLLAIMFAGKGIAALQDAGQLPFNPVSFPRIELLGIYPNAQGLVIQAVMLGLALLALFGSRLRLARQR